LYDLFATYITCLGFVEAKSDTSLFIFWHDSDMIYLLLYVDDIVLTTSSATLLQQTISAFKREFNIRLMGSSSHIVSLLLTWWTTRRFLRPVDTKAKVTVESEPPIANLTHFSSLAGALQYLKFTRPNIAYDI
jgi:hypothetical protein